MNFPGVYRWRSDMGDRLVVAYNPGTVLVTVIETSTLRRSRVPIGHISEDADTAKLSLKRTVRRMDRRRKMFKGLKTPPKFAEKAVIELRRSVVDV